MIVISSLVEKSSFLYFVITSTLIYQGRGNLSLSFLDKNIPAPFGAGISVLRSLVCCNTNSAELLSKGDVYLAVFSVRLDFRAVPLEPEHLPRFLAGDTPDVI